MVRVTKLNLHRTISDIMNKGNLDSLTTKKIRLLCEAKYNTDLSERKDEIDNIVLDFVRMKSQELRAAERNQQANPVNANKQRNTNADKNVTSDEESSASEEDGSADSEEEGGSEDGEGSGGSEEGSSCSGSESCSDSECSSDMSDEEADSKVHTSTHKKAAVNVASPKKASSSSVSSKGASVAGSSKGVSVIAGSSKETTAISGSSKKVAASAVTTKKAATKGSTLKKPVSNADPAKKATVHAKKRVIDREADNAVQLKKPKRNDAAKKIELDDAALARKLQAEEWNFRRGTVNKLFRNTPQKKVEQTKNRKSCPFMKKCLLSPALAEVLGTNEMSRPDIVQKMWSVVRERNLFDASNKQYALCDEQLQNVFGKKRVRLIGMMKYLKHHIKDVK